MGLRALQHHLLSAAVVAAAAAHNSVLPRAVIEWKETTGIASCGSSDWTAFRSDPFGGGMDGKCALFPTGAAVQHTVDACKSLCAPAAHRVAGKTAAPVLAMRQRGGTEGQNVLRLSSQAAPGLVDQGDDAAAARVRV